MDIKIVPNGHENMFKWTKKNSSNEHKNSLNEQKIVQLKLFKWTKNSSNEKKIFQMKMKKKIKMDIKIVPNGHENSSKGKK